MRLEKWGRKKFWEWENVKIYVWNGKCGVVVVFGGDFGRFWGNLGGFWGNCGEMGAPPAGIPVLRTLRYNVFQGRGFEDVREDGAEEVGGRV